jgi:peptidyl-prolyl cis-trans isomerase D
MLKSMRNNVKSLAPILWGVIAAFIISIFAVWGGGGELGKGRATNVLVTVGREKISASLYYQTLRQELERMRQQFKDLDSRFIQQLNIPQQVLEQLIQQSLLLQAARDMGLQATGEEVAEKIKSYPVFQKDGQFIGFEEYKKILEWNRISLSLFEESLNREILLEKAVDVITSGVTISPEELWETYKNNNETAKMEYIVCEAEKIEVSDNFSQEGLKEYYKEHQDEYEMPERREADYVFFLTETIKEEMQLDESDISKYYEENLTQFQDPERIRVSRVFLPLEDKEKEEVRKKAQEILERLNKGEPFDAMAQIYSHDDKALDGGDWGLFEWRNLPSVEQDQIDRMAAGETAGPLETENGLSILKITEREPVKQKSLEEVRERIITILKDQKAREFMEGKASQLEKAARKEKSLDLAAQQFGQQIKSTVLLKEGDPIEEIDPSGSISFSLFQLEEGEISPPVTTYKGIGVAQLKKVETARPAEYEEVEEEVKADFLNERKKAEALEKIQKAREEFGKKDFVEIADDSSIEYRTVEEHKRNQYIGLIGENAEVDSLAFSLPIETVSQPVDFDGGYLLLRVLDRKEVTRKDLEENKSEERRTILQTERNKFLTSYLNKIREEMGVSIKYDLFYSINQDVLSRYQTEE